MSGNQGDNGMWPSLETASFISDVANWAFIASLVVGVVATVLIVWMGSVKETHWDHERQISREKIASLGVAVSDANARAAEANRIAEAERLARIKIESELASRRLSPEAALHLREFLSQSKDRPSIIRVILLGDMEAHTFGVDFIKIFESEGIKISLSLVGSMSPPPYGIFVTDTPNGVLKAAFEAADIPHVTYMTETNTMPSVLVGLKPPPF